MAQVAVIGLGRFGFHVARCMHLAGHDVLAIDSDPLHVQRIRDFSSRAVVLDARDKERLEALGIRDFDVVVVSLGERVDASALVTLHLKELGVERLIAKAGSVDHGKLLERIGVAEVVFPEREAAERLAHRLTHPNVIDYIPLGLNSSIHEVSPPASFVGRTLGELKLRNRFKVQVLAIRDAETQDVSLNPDAEVAIRETDTLLVLGRDEDLDRLKKA
jgi:trk system potassium uptake protein TrkA